VTVQTLVQRVVKIIGLIEVLVSYVLEWKC